MRARVTTLLLGVAVSGLLTSCTQATPSGATINNGVISILYRPCAKMTSIGELKVYDVTDFSRPPVWSARLADPTAGKLDIPITADVPGYTVDDQLHGRLDPNRNYRVEGASDKGVSWEGPTFKPRDLRAGKVRESGRYDDLGSWIGRHPRCTSGPGSALAVGGLAVGMTAGLVLAAVAVVRQRRRNPAV